MPITGPQLLTACRRAFPAPVFSPRADWSREGSRWPIRLILPRVFYSTKPKSFKPFKKFTPQPGRPRIWDRSSVTYLCHDVENADQAELLGRIRPVAHHVAYGLMGVKLFISTGLAGWLDNGHTFLSALASRLLQGTQNASKSRLSQLTIDVVVVDRLPGPSALEASDEVNMVDQLSTGSFGAYEGLAIRVYPSQNSSRNDGGPTNEKTRHVPFVRFAHTEARSTGLYQRQVYIQPANTLFVNGSETTMFRVKTTVPNTSDPQLLFSEREHQSRCAILAVPGGNHYLDIPLIPLTKPRRVVSSMGNVVSSLENPDPGDKEIPASAELEHAVSKFLQEQDTTSTEVFAYIRHADIVPYASIGESENNFNWSTAMDSGTLHKVTGGGGGWGAKRGLLSLDPIDILSEPSDPYFADEDMTNSISSIAQPGDTIQFFGTAPSAPSAPRYIKDRTGSGEKDKNGVSSVVMFGKLSSTSSDHDAKKVEVSTKWTTIPNFFGMLSERNVAIATWTHPEISKKLRSRVNVPNFHFTHIEAYRNPDESKAGPKSHGSEPNEAGDHVNVVRKIHYATQKNGQSTPGSVQIRKYTSKIRVKIRTTDQPIRK